MRASTKRALAATVLAGAVVEHELSGHGVPHVEIHEPGDPYVVVSQQNLLASGENLATSPRLNLRTPGRSVGLDVWGGTSGEL